MRQRRKPAYRKIRVDSVGRYRICGARHRCSLRAHRAKRIRKNSDRTAGAKWSCVIPRNKRYASSPRRVRSTQSTTRVSIRLVNESCDSWWLVKELKAEVDNARLQILGALSTGNRPSCVAGRLSYGWPGRRYLVGSQHLPLGPNRLAGVPCRISRVRMEGNVDLGNNHGPHDYLLGRRPGAEGPDPTWFTNGWVQIILGSISAVFTFICAAPVVF